jgi:predicted dehydrogenase/acetyltransferase-like isoleucine patch superfamily enzyme
MTAPTESYQSLSKVAVIGCGHWGRNLVRNFHVLGALAAVCDGAPARAQEEAERHGVRALTFEEILAAPEIDAVVLATPAESHARLAVAAIEAGKHVFIEKPLALELAAAHRVAAAAAARNRLLMVGHLLHYHPAFLALHDLIAQGKLGRLQYIYSNRLNLGKFRREEDVFWSFAPHDISMILALAGELPESVEAVGHCYLHKKIADVTTTHLRFGSGLNAHIFVSWLHPSKEQRLIAIGDHGMAIFDDGEPWSRKLVLYAHRVTWHNGMPEPSRGDPVYFPLSEGEPLRLECQHFLESIRKARPPRTDVHEGIRVLRVLDAARRSLASSRVVELGAAPEGSYFVHESAYVDGGCEIGPDTKIWHFTHVLKGSRIGRECTIGQNVMIGPDVVVGDRCKIQNNVSLYKGVVLEDGVFCGPSCVFTNVLNPRAEIERKDEFRTTIVGRGATIGAHATIVCGCSIGPYSFVAAGAVVTRDVPSHALVAGVPARRIGWMSHAGYRLGDDLFCPHTGDRYAPDGRGGLMRISQVREVA